ALAVAAGAPAFGFSLARWTDAAFPYWDSLITVLSLAAQTALSRKWLDAWVLWIAVDAIAIPVYAARGLWFAAALYAVFLVMAVGGLGTWWKALHTA
ncbi:MAG: nicotinamide mononucleotide transporter, partial [Candidatus Brocadiae bacterium]|nr:nicotinamide mononucleotide transporter [Candidatus Brocadiia bacterium]